MQLVDKLEETLAQGMRVPMARRVLVDEEALLNLIDQMRIAIPNEIKEARAIQLERDRYIAQAHDEARQILAQAREDVARLLDEHLLRQTAEAQAEEILKAARNDAAKIRAGADEYATGKLRELEASVAQLQAVIANGLNALEGRQAARSASTESGEKRAS